LISASFDSLELDFINILFCVYTSTFAFNNVSGIVLDALDFKILSKIYIQRQILFDFLNVFVYTTKMFDIVTAFKAKLGLLENQRSCITLLISCT
jgi:hypothetical protein